MGKFDDRIDAVFADMAIPQRPGGALLVIDHGETAGYRVSGFVLWHSTASVQGRPLAWQ
jgi:hypothetical protein